MGDAVADTSISGFFKTIRFGDLLTVGAIVGGGFTFLMSQQASQEVLRSRIEGMETTVKALDVKIEGSAKALVEIARQDERLKNIDRSIMELRDRQQALGDAMRGDPAGPPRRR